MSDKELILVVILVGVVAMVVGAYSNVAQGEGSDELQRWNEAKQCYDVSDYPPTFEAREKVGDGYDPNWVSATPMANGCTFYFHPTQGVGNGPAEAPVDNSEVPVDNQATIETKPFTIEPEPAGCRS